MSTDFGTAYQEDAAYKAAFERAEMLQGYYTHLLVYVVVNTGLFFINLFTRGNDGGWWFYWPLLGWGIGLMIHTMVVFGGVFSEGWKQRKADEIYRRAERSSQHPRGGDEG
jgi:2TM domain-containing protein